MLNLTFKRLLLLPAALITGWSLHSEIVPITVRLPNAPSVTEESSYSGSPVWAGTNRFVFFVSDAPNLVTNDWNGAGVDLFRRDRLLGTTLLVSAAKNPQEGANRPVAEFSVSKDGRYAAFVTDASNIVDGDTNDTTDVFVRDLDRGTTHLVSWNVERTGPGVGASFRPILSADGRRVLYGTSAANVLPETTPLSGSRLCIREVEGGAVTILNDEPWWVEASESLDVVVYATESAVLSGDWLEGRYPTVLMVWRAATGVTERIQVPSPWGIQGRALDVSHGFLTPSGRHIALYIPDQGTRVRDARGVWRIDLESRDAVRVWAPESALVPRESEWISFTDDGRRMAFTTPLPPRSDFGVIQIWEEGKGLKSLSEWVTSPPGQTASLSRARAVKLSPEGDRLVFHTMEPVPEAGVDVEDIERAYLRILTNGVTRVLSTGDNDVAGTFDSTGEFLAFSAVRQRPSTESGYGSDVLVVDRSDAAPVVLSVPVATPDSTTSRATLARVIGLSDDGQRILYFSTARDLVTNRASGVNTYLYDVAKGTNLLMNVNQRGVSTSPFQGQNSVLSAAGNVVVFGTSDSDFAVTNSHAFNIRLRPVDGGDPLLASPETASPSDEPSVAGGRPFQVSGDGRRVAYQWSDRLTAPPVFDTDRNDLLPYLWEGASTPESAETLVSSDGERVGYAWDGWAGWFDYGQRRLVRTRIVPSLQSRVLHTPSQGESLIALLRDPLTGGNTVLKVNPVSGDSSVLISPRDYAVGRVQVSADGLIVAFSGLKVGENAAGDPVQLFVRPLHGAGFERISTGFDGLPANGSSRSLNVSGNGQFVVFTSAASNLVPGDTNGVADVFIRDRFAGVTHLLSRGDDGVQENGPCAGAHVSADGGSVVFTTFGTRLVPGDRSPEPTLVRATVPKATPVDTDADGLPDVWENDHLGTLTYGGSDDPDQDGQSNRDEYLARNSPADSASRLALVGARRVEGGVEVSWHGHSGVAYQMERADALNGGSWTAVGDPVSGYEGLIHQSGADTPGSGLFRIRAVPYGR